MPFVADFHIHSRYSRATSKNMNVEALARRAKLKGIDLLGTGDFTHHLWLEELRTKLHPLGNGLFSGPGVNFILTAEISTIYTKNGKGRRIHLIVFAPGFEDAGRINEALTRLGANLVSDGRPILGMDAEFLVGVLLDASPDCFIVPGHAWTPWFSVFGANSGFDSVEECFGKETKNIFALETGLSSDPAMNWRWSALDRYSLISNSDAHSPERIGREANVFDGEMSYAGIVEALKKKDRKKFLSTIEFFPEEGKYHYDGHRACNVCLSPAQTREQKCVCPACGKKLTVGVMYRVEELSDRPAGFVPANAIPFRRMIPLAEIIGEALEKGVATAAVENVYNQAVTRLGNEFRVLLEIPEEDLRRSLPERVAEGIVRVRKGEVKIAPGYDGVYGKIEIFGKEERKPDKQLTLF